MKGLSQLFLIFLLLGGIVPSPAGEIEMAHQTRFDARISPPFGPLMSFLNGLHSKSNFLA